MPILSIVLAHSSNRGVLPSPLARDFEEVGEEIKIGVMQHLLNRLYKTKIDTVEIGLYNSFIKKLMDYVETERVDPYLKERFDLLNHTYFDGFMITPNLVWGTHSTTKLGHYAYASDTISISTALKENEELLDYVLYHEMLHKKHKFTETKGGHTRSHTKAFRDEEKLFRMADGSDPEKALTAFLIRKKRQGRILKWFEL
jgi:predicted metal-dependent hydrolase